MLPLGGEGVSKIYLRPVPADDLTLLRIIVVPQLAGSCILALALAIEPLPL